MAETASKKTADNRPRLLLMDGHSLAYRAFYALPAENFTTAVGQPTNAVYGFMSMLANTLRDEAPTHFAVAFDVSRKTWRAQEFPEYKANRSKTPDEFKGQVELIGELLDAMHADRFAVDGFEADDVIATLATQAEAAGFEVLIVTGDRDSFQLITENVTVLYPTKGVSELTRFTPEKIVEKYGLTPQQYPDFAALRGDPSDNLPSIPGVGEKTAAKWINQFGSFGELMERAEEVKGKAGQNLRDHLDAVKMNRVLTEMVRDVELPKTPVDLERAPYDRTAVTGILDILEIRNPSLRERLLAVDPGAAEAEPPEQDALMAQARAVLDLGDAFTTRLKEVGAAELLHDMELPTSILLARLERHGIAADRAHLESMEQQFAGTVQQAVKEAHAAVGREFNLGSPKQLQEILFGELGLPKTKKTKTGYTTDADALAWLAAQTEHELPVLMLRHREQAKLRVTVEGLIKTIAADGRIHTTFNQTVAATGRLSSTEPNLQNIPVRTDEGRAIRRGFVVGEGFETLMTADYSQIELRVMAHLSEDAGLIEAFTSGEDLHTTVASQVFGVDKSAVDPEMRRKIKAMSYGLAYGLSAFGLSQQLNIDPAEARVLMDTYFERFGGVRDYLHRVVEEARATGYTETILGRRRYLPDLNSDNRQRREAAERMALNAPIQGTAADIVKVAMLRVDRALREAELTSRMLLQVHDEIVLEIAGGERKQVEEILRREMKDAVELRAPLDVSIGVGKDWESAAH
ncbi:DNA polymerase I [Streptomyces sp. S6]|nr:DNA polymerase I [Streptomyces sp. S6]